MKKPRQLYVLTSLVECNSTISSFDLWMLKGVHDILCLINFKGINWPKTY